MPMLTGQAGRLTAMAPNVRASAMPKPAPTVTPHNQPWPRSRGPASATPTAFASSSVSGPTSPTRAKAAITTAGVKKGARFRSLGVMLPCCRSAISCSRPASRLSAPGADTTATRSSSPTAPSTTSAMVVAPQPPYARPTKVPRHVVPPRRQLAALTTASAGRIAARNWSGGRRTATGPGPAAIKRLPATSTAANSASHRIGPPRPNRRRAPCRPPRAPA